MATLANANLPSEDEEDEDFIPNEVDSEEEAANRGKDKKKQAKKHSRRRGPAAARDESEDEEEDGSPLIDERKQAAKKAKVDELWSKLNKKSSFGLATSGVRMPAPISNLSQPLKREGRTDDGFIQQPSSGVSDTDSKHDESDSGKKDAKAVAEAALIAAKAAASVAAAQQYGMVTVSETRRFAGQNITVNKQVAANSKEAEKLASKSAAGAAGEQGNSSSETSAAARKKAGLDAVLASLAQAKKVTVLDKSRSDWRDFKQSDTTIEEELETHKRSGATYLEKQAFLGRVEHAEYEKERDRRLASDVRNRGRL